MKRFSLLALPLLATALTTVQPARAAEPDAKPVTAESAVPNSASDIRPILTGSKLPKITLRDAAGKTVDLNASVAEKPAVLIFYRGGWCPFCNTHLSQLRDTVEPLKQLGYELLAVSPDIALELAITAAKNKVDYRLLSDSSMTAARALGIAFRLDDPMAAKYREHGIDLEKSSGEKHHQLPVPGVFLIGRDGTIHFSYVNPNFRVRLAPEVLLAAARAYKDEATKAPKKP